MQIAVLTFDSFNELDSIVVASMLNRLTAEGWHAYITAPTKRVVSRSGLAIEAQQPLEFTEEADAVVFGSGGRSAQLAEDPEILRRIRVDPQRQWIASQCSGALFLHRLGLVAGMPVCTDVATRPALTQLGVEVLDRPFHAQGNVATAGGCLSSQYIAAWLVCRGLGIEAAERLIHYVAPVGEKQDYVDRALAAVRPYLPPSDGSLPVPVSRSRSGA